MGRRARKPVEIPSHVTVTYQLQYRKCGKASCGSCRNGQGHGPYWYGYWHERGERSKFGRKLKQGRLHSVYIGKVHPDLIELTDQIEQQAHNVV